jgi:hypothetical protein
VNSLNKKFELTNEFVVNIFGIKLFRIKAILKLRYAEAGELGGFVEKEENVNQSDDAWVYGDAWVSGNARVYGNAWIKKSTHLFQLGAIGSRNGFTTFFRVETNQIHVSCGCFLGSIEEFEKAVEKYHAGTKHERTYKLAIQLAKEQIELDDLYLTHIEDNSTF